MRQLFLAVFLFLVLGTKAQFQPSYYMLNTNDGLACNTIYELMQINDGEIFIGHDKGLTKFNGFRFTDFSADKVTPLRNMVPLDENRILVSNFVDELFLANNHTDQVEVFDSISVKELGFSVYYRIGDDIYRIKNDKLIKFIEGKKIVNETLYKLPFVSSIYNFCVGSKGVSYFRSGDWSFSFDHETEEVKEHTLTNNKNQMYLFNYLDVVYLFDPGKNELRNMDDTLASSKLLQGYQSNDKITCFYESKDHELLVGTFNGLYIFDQYLNFKAKYYDDYQISCITETNEGELWLGTLNDGIIVIPNRNSWTWNRDKNLLKKEKISNVHVSSDEKILLGTYLGHLFEIEKSGRVTKFVDFNVNHEIQGIFSDREILAFCKFLNVVDSSSFEKVKELKPYPTKDVIRINERNIYCATSSGLVVIRNGEYLTLLKEHWMRQIMFYDPYLIVESSSGIQLIDTSTFEIVNEQLFDNDARSLLSGGSKLFNSEKEFFFCNKNLVYEVSGKQLLMRQVLPSTSIVSICKIGDFFYSSDGKTISANSGEIQFTIDESKGLTIKDIQFLINWDEDLLIVGKEQIQLFKLPVEFNSMIPNVKLSSVEGSFKSTKTSFESDFLGNELIMQFQVWPNLKSRGKDVLFYKIEGIHTDWQSSTSENDYRIVEDRLPYGTYKVVFYVANEDGVTSDVQEFEIIIHSPYYMKWWFFMSLGLLVLGIFFLIYRWRISVLNKRNLKKIEEEKLKIKALQSELKALRSQMNPHFIFNTLGVIQSKILNEDSKGAYQNLSTFSKLLRQALMFTTKEFITIREEIEFIQNYVQLIQARNPNSFSYTVKISETVDLNIMFPSLISQPYVENAIRHGLMHKLEGSKSLIVKIQGNNDDLKFVIEDNGIGRDASTKLNKEIRENHESFATKAMDSRIEIINLSQPFKWSVEIIDLEEGTRVIIHQVRKNEQPKTASDIS